MAITYNNETRTCGGWSRWMKKYHPDRALSPGGISERNKQRVKHGYTVRQVINLDDIPEYVRKNLPVKRSVNKNQGKIERCMVKAKFSSMVLVPQ